MNEFVVAQASSGLYGSPEEYLRALVRNEFERGEELRLASLVQQIREGAVANPSEFVEVDINELIAEAERELDSQT